MGFRDMHMHIHVYVSPRPAHNLGFLVSQHAAWEDRLLSFFRAGMREDCPRGWACSPCTCSLQAAPPGAVQPRSQKSAKGLGMALGCSAEHRAGAETCCGRSDPHPGGAPRADVGCGAGGWLAVVAIGSDCAVPLVFRCFYFIQRLLLARRHNAHFDAA